MAAKMPPTTNLKTFTGGGATFDEPLWDRIPLVSTETRRELFTIGVGEVDPVSSARKTQADTNLRSQGIPKGQGFRIYGFGLKYLAIAKRTVDQLVLIQDMFRNTTFNFFIDDKTQYGRCTLDYIMGDPMPVQVSLAATNNYAYQSVGSLKGYWPLNEFIDLANLVDFHVELEHFDGVPDAALNDDLVKIECCGLKARRAIS